MPFETLLSKVIKRRKPEREPSDGKGIDGKDAKKEESSSEEEKETEPEWIMIQDPQGRLAWQHRKTGQVTYGQSYTGYNQAAAGAALDDDSDSDDDDDDKKKKPAAPAPAPAPVAVAPVAVQYPAQYPPGVGYMPSPVHPMGYMPSPVPYGVSPVAMYPAAPWNAMPVSPVPMQVPEYIKRQHAEAQKEAQKKAEEKKKKAAEEKKRIAAGVWERHYTNDGGKFWQHSVTGKKVSEDPFR